MCHQITRFSTASSGDQFTLGIRDVPPGTNLEDIRSELPADTPEVQYSVSWHMDDPSTAVVYITQERMTFAAFSVQVLAACAEVGLVAST